MLGHGPSARGLGGRPPATAVTAAQCLSRPALGSRPLVTAVTSPDGDQGDGERPARPSTQGFRGGVGRRGSGFHHPISRPNLEVEKPFPPTGEMCDLAPGAACRPIRQSWPSGVERQA
jgi:hypothetical protein